MASHPNSKIRILIVDDHPLVRAGIVALLRNEKDILVVGEADNGREAVEKAKALSPHIVLMDIRMPGTDGIDATGRIAALKPPVRVIALTQYDDEEYVRRIMQIGASGYVLKNSVAEELLRAIRAVYKGEQYLTAAVAKMMIDSYVRQATGQVSQKPPATLTQREREILKYVAEGNTNHQIATALSISVRTVEFHRANITEKTGIHDLASLVKYAIQKKIISLDM